MRTVAVVLAGGAGLRTGGTAPKQLQLLAGRTLLEHSVAAFDQAPGVDDVVVVMAADFVSAASEILGSRYSKVSAIIVGGADRPDSTRRAIDLIDRAGADRAGADHLTDDGGQDCNVLFHDAARPLVDQRIIADCVAGLAACQALGV